MKKVYLTKPSSKMVGPFAGWLEEFNLLILLSSLHRFEAAVDRPSKTPLSPRGILALRKIAKYQIEDSEQPVSCVKLSDSTSRSHYFA
jgi:hypothetical protein